MDTSETENSVIKTESSEAPADVGPVKKRRRNLFDIKPEGMF
jgi:hypothetical protein